MNQTAPQVETELDLTTEPPVTGGQATPRERDYDPEPEREKVRARIAQGLTAAVLTISILAFVLVAKGALERDEVESLQIFFTPLITLAGTALGFYFGGTQRK